MRAQAYLQGPSLYKETIVFTTDDDLWSVSKFGGQARRLTTSKGLSHSPYISPDGQWIAYLSNDHSQQDIYLIPLNGGPSKRVSYCGGAQISGWKDSSRLIYSTNKDAIHPRVQNLFELNLKTEESKALKLGHASSVHYDGKKSLLGKNLGDPARWKRYRGGTAGTLWVDETGKGDFKQILKGLKTNLSNPLWIDGRVFFISDHEGIGNIYSCPSRGGKLKRHTHSEDYYIRNFSYHDETIIYQQGGEIFELELKSGTSRKVDIQVSSNFPQSQMRFEDAEDHIDNFALSSKSEVSALISRGALFLFKTWGGAPYSLGYRQRRYRQAIFVKSMEDKLLTVELDENNEEALVLFNIETLAPKKVAQTTDFGKIYKLKANPTKPLIALMNNRCELWLINLKTNKANKIDVVTKTFINDASWSPCGRYLSYSKHIDQARSGIVLYDTKLKKTSTLLNPVLHDHNPEFSPCGRYLYFIGIREFHPQYEETHFELGFPRSSRPYALVLSKESPDPMELYHHEEIDEEEEEKKKKGSKGKKDNIPETIIDWDGIESRVVSIPLELGGYEQLFASKDKLLFLRSIPKGINPLMNEEESSSNLYSYDFKENKKELIHKGIFLMHYSSDKEGLILANAEGIRAISPDSKPSDGEGFNKKDGWIDLSAIKVKVDPKEEWKQIYQEAWILQREHFWTKDMSKIDWVKVFKRYSPLLEQINTRKEFSDLMWEMQGELGTSHCYEFGGDYYRHPEYAKNASLASTFKWNAKNKTMTIDDLAYGDSWIKAASSPLRGPDIGLEKGDQIIAINGVKFDGPLSLERELEARAGDKVNLEVKKRGQKKSDFYIVKTIHHSSYTRYRDWVESNKEYVHKKSKGKLGYVHIPNMAAWGYSEFYRHFLSEFQHQGLIIDVRYNGGGHVSQHLLKILAQRTIGFDQTRYFGVETYPQYSVNGPLVCLTNEHAGSDGDIFSHSFKLMGLGKLVGKRTWGGVVGIWPRIPLKDGTLTSQPEFSFWFKDVGYGVENYGTDPDFEVDILPKDWALGRDPQLDKAIDVALKGTKNRPHLKVDLKKSRPHLKLPKLPKI